MLILNQEVFLFWFYLVLKYQTFLFLISFFYLLPYTLNFYKNIYATNKIIINESNKNFNKVLEGKEIEIVEYPQNEENFMKFAAKIGSTNYLNLLPEQLSQELEVLNVIPILLDNEIQMLLPYSFIIK